MDDLYFFVPMLGEKVDGLGWYTDRSELLPYDVSYLYGGGNEEDLLAHHKEHLAPLGIGVREIRFLNGENLFEALLDDPRERARLRAELSDDEKMTLESFSSDYPWPEFLAALDVDPSCIRTPDREVANRLDNKRQFRLIAESMNRSNVIPKHQFARTFLSAAWRTKRLLRKYSSVYLKTDDLESGVGTMCVTQDTSWWTILKHAWKYQNLFTDRRFICEEGRDGSVASLQWYLPLVMDEGKLHPQKRFMSRQYVNGVVHDGNVIGKDDYLCFPQEWPLHIRKTAARKAWDVSRSFVIWAMREGYVGFLGFDFIADYDVVSDTVDVLFIEANARKTAGTYLESVRWQVEMSGRVPTACAAMRNCHPVLDGVGNWRDAEAVLQSGAFADGMGDILMKPDTGVGVFIANPRLLHLERPKCLLISVASNVWHAEQLIHAAVNRLEAHTEQHVLHAFNAGSAH